MSLDTIIIVITTFLAILGGVVSAHGPQKRWHKGLYIAAFAIAGYTADLITIRSHRPAPVAPELEIKVVLCEGHITPLQAYYIALEVLQHVPIKVGRFEVTARNRQISETQGRLEVALGNSDMRFSCAAARVWKWGQSNDEVWAMGLIEGDLVEEFRSHSKKKL